MKSARKTKAQLIKELDALRKINATIGTLLDLNAVLQRIVNEIVPLFAAQAASVILFDYAKQEAEITTVYGTQPQRGQPFRYPWHGSLAGWVMEHKRPLRLSRPLSSEWPTSAKLAEELGGSLETVSILLAPLCLNDQVLGCLEVVWDPRRDIPDGDEQLLETVATQVAIAIANAQLYTERKRGEEALRSAKEYAETLIKSSIDMIVAVNTDRRITEFNPAAEKGFGYQRAEVIGQPVDLLYAEAGPGPDINREVRTTGRYIGEVRNKRKNGEIFNVHLEASLLQDVTGNVVGVMGISRDITDRKHAEDALRASEERYRIVSQCISDYAFSFRMEDGKTPFLEWITDSFTRVTGYPTSSVLGESNPWARYVHPQDLERVNATIRHIQPNVPSTYEFRLLRNDGAIRWIRSSAYIVRDETHAVTRLYGAAQDITERKHAEDVVQYQRAFDQLVANISKDFLNLAPEEIDTGILRALQAVGEFSGIDRSYLFLFRENLALMDNTHEWCAPGIASEQSKLQNMATSTFPWFVKKLVAFEAIYIPDVSALPPEARAEQVEFQSQGMQSLVSIPLVSGKTVIGLLAFAAVRTTKCWTAESLLLLKVVGEMIANALERKWAAERQQHLHAQLLQTQKLEAIGTLAGGIAHDFNNILAAIMGYTELAMDDVPNQGLTRSNLEEVLTASRRARGLVQQLLTFSRPSHQDRRPIQLHDIVEGTLTLLRASLPKHIDIHLAFRTPLAIILADPTQIEQVVMNLCVNAAYAIGDHPGVLGIGLDYVEGARVTDPTLPSLSTTTAYCLTISDTGCGIAPETLSHIFEPFFTTKPIGHGSGMGLAIVHGIVTSHGGGITVESHPGQGTTFRVYFPPLGESVATQGVAMSPSNQELTA